MDASHFQIRQSLFFFFSLFGSLLSLHLLTHSATRLKTAVESQSTPVPVKDRPSLLKRLPPKLLQSSDNQLIMAAVLSTSSLLKKKKKKKKKICQQIMAALYQRSTKGQLESADGHQRRV